MTPHRTPRRCGSDGTVWRASAFMPQGGTGRPAIDAARCHAGYQEGVRIVDDPETDSETGPDRRASDSAEPDAAWLALHAEREAVERALTLAQAHQRFGTETEAIARARLEETDLLVKLDRILTQIRAAEYRRRPGSRRW